MTIALHFTNYRYHCVYRDVIVDHRMAKISSESLWAISNDVTTSLSKTFLNTPMDEYIQSKILETVCQLCVCKCARAVKCWKLTWLYVVMWSQDLSMFSLRCRTKIWCPESQPYRVIEKWWRSVNKNWQAQWEYHWFSACQEIIVAVCKITITG